MIREGHDNVSFFHGTEVEHTPAFGKRTLFVVGVQSTDEIAKHLTGCEHIFFGANHSFNPVNNKYLEWQSWETMIQYFLEKGYLCSLDIPISAVEQFNDGGLNEYNNFIPQIRIGLPYIRLWNYNTMIKIDDKDFDATNPGVWCHRLHNLLDTKAFTSWDAYTKDEIL